MRTRPLRLILIGAVLAGAVLVLGHGREQGAPLGPPPSIPPAAAPAPAPVTAVLPPPRVARHWLLDQLPDEGGAGPPARPGDDRRQAGAVLRGRLC